MARPSVKLVRDWQVVYSSAEVEVGVGSAVFHCDYWYVIDKKSKKKKYFYGEMAHSDARRIASDFDFGAWRI
jgi:hypothetical protein